MSGVTLSSLLRCSSLLSSSCSTLFSVMEAEKATLICYVHMTADYDDDNDHDWDVTKMSSVPYRMYFVLCILLDSYAVLLSLGP